jgi:hypothetical protein
MIESIMNFGIGFLFAALSVLVVVPLVHCRAVRLTTRRLEGATPSSMAKMRAEFAISTQRLEMNVEELKNANASQLVGLGKKGDAINRFEIELGALRDRLRAAEEELAIKATAAHEAERALSDKESELAKLVGELEEQSILADAQKIEIIALKTQVETKATAVHEAERALSDKESELAKLVGELEERSILADAQKMEIIALKTEVEALKERLDGAKAVEDRHDADRIELKAATQELMEERSKFEKFHRHVAELVRQVMARTVEDEILGCAPDLENRLVEQSRLLNEKEFELKHLHGEIELAHKAEADLRIAIIEIEGRANTATQNLEAEKAKLQAALDRANGECVRLTYELKRETWVA